MRKLFIVFSILLFVSQMQVGYMRLHPYVVSLVPYRNNLVAEFRSDRYTSATIFTWLDQSGNGNNATSTNINLPTVSEDSGGAKVVMNGAPLSITTLSIAATEPVTIAVRYAASSNYYKEPFYGATTPSGKEFYWAWTDASNARASRSPAGTLPAVAYPGNNVDVTVVVRYPGSGAAITCRVNGVNISSTSSGTPDELIPVINLGGAGTGTGLVTHLRRVCIYKEVLSDENAQIVEAYLSSQY